MAKSESEIKTAFVKMVRHEGGWGRRHEDQYAVGILDVEVILPPHILQYSPVFIIEGKLIKNQTFGPSERQWVEMVRITSAQGPIANLQLRAIPVLMGYKNGQYMFSAPAKVVRMEDCYQQEVGQNAVETLAKWYLKWAIDGK